MLRDLLQQKLATLQKQRVFLEIEEIKAYDSRQKFKLKEEIEETKRKIEDTEKEISDLSGGETGQSFVEFPPGFRPNVDRPPLPPTAEEPGACHLLIVVFWRKRTERKISLKSELHYRDPVTDKTEKYPIDDWERLGDRPRKLSDLDLSDLPGCIEAMRVAAIGKAKQLFPNQKIPWQIVIELFLPSEVIGKPISDWCDLDGATIACCPLIVRCSDRYNPQLGTRADNLRNQLYRGWQLLQEHVPDGSGKKLKQLKWARPQQQCRESLYECSGLRCVGVWLNRSRKEEYSKRWRELVLSGIPLALWICEGQGPAMDIAATLNRLVDCTRFEFFRKIQALRTSPQCRDYCVGIFYENPEYEPTVADLFTMPNQSR